MIQQRKKDYLQRLIEEFFGKIHVLQNRRQKEDSEEIKNILNNSFDFFSKNFDVKQSDTAETIVQKVGDLALLEQYAGILFYKHQAVDIKEPDQLQTALDIIDYIEAVDKTYSWERTVLREDLLRLLDKEGKDIRD